MDFILLLPLEQDPKILKLQLVAYFSMKTGAQLALASMDSHQSICHAEINAILNSAKNAKYLFTVLSPCVSCAKTIAATSIKEVYFIKQYYKGGKDADLKYAKIFDLFGIKCFQASKDSLLNIEKVMKSELENIKNLYDA
jgi:deoxycytidylate deaminase